MGGQREREGGEERDARYDVVLEPEGKEAVGVHRNRHEACARPTFGT